MLTHSYQVFLNIVAQGKATSQSAQAWFLKLAPDAQGETLTWLCHALLQAGAVDADVRPALAKSEIRPTVSAATALSAGPLRVQVGKLLRMKGKDAYSAFRVLLALFVLADERRRQKFCKNGCTHWWHNVDGEWVGIKNEFDKQLH